MEPYSRYEDALLAKMRLHEWYSTADGERYLHSMFEEMNSHHDPTERMPADGLVFLQRRMIQEADPIYVSMDITDLVDHARWSFEPEVLLPGDPFVPRGFAILPKPIYMEDAPLREGKPVRYEEGIPIRAIAWMPLHSEDLSVGCYWIAFYAHIEDDVELQGKLVASGGLNAEEKIAYFRRYAPLTLVHQWQWSWGNVPTESTALVYGNETQEAGDIRSRNQAALVQTFWRIGQQRVPVPERVPRGIWRDAQRKGFDHREVKVMTLRRAREPREYEPTGRQMKVRSITEGHFRNQYYASLGDCYLEDGTPNPESHRQIWVFPFVRGPEGAPLITPERAVEFKR